ncbi:MAG TPA: PIN domain-containing protein [Acidimicrobiales bacterium]|nr:PIN domain-containing protein [Acidimicrobiales bacterium]
MSGAVLDTGALVGFERNDRRVVAIVARALDHEDILFVPAGVVAQAWRDGSRQARLARLLGSTVCEVVVLDDYRARAAGQLCGATDTADVVDSSVVVAARERRVRIITSDPDDLRRLDPHADLVVI